jgi:dienelactone hydrolase
MVRVVAVRGRSLSAAAARAARGGFVMAGCTLVVAGCGSGGVTRSATAPTLSAPSTASVTATSLPSVTTTARLPPSPRPPHPPFAVGERIVRLVDPTRMVQFPGQAPEPRTLVTLIRYPAHGSVAGTDVAGAAPERAAGPFPLVIFGHGFAVTPGPYAQLLQTWARAGYVVAAPLFPLENTNAPGGPNESDLVNQPRDMSFLITRMLQASADSSSFLHGLIASHRIAVSGQSDGGETALAVAYDNHFLDSRIRAAVILSGAEIPGVGGFDFPSPSPPLLATQGTADTINPPSFTHAFFDIAPRPKYLLTMFGAPHLGPYTGEQPQQRIVERVTIAFLDRYLKNAHDGVRRMVSAGDVPGLSALQADG